MSEHDQSTMRILQAAAYIVIIAWGIRTASHILSVFLIALLLTYAILPFPKWLRRRFQLRKGVAIVLTLAFVATIYLIVTIALVEASFHLRERLPIYMQQFQSLSERIVLFLNAHGIQSTHVLSKNSYSPDQIADFAIRVLPQAVNILSDRLLVWLLSLIFLIELADTDTAKTGPLARNLVHYGKDVQRYIAITAQLGAMTGLANLMLLIALGVDFPILWCFLYFFLQFIPSIGFLIALIPPTFMALIMLGWQRALLVAAGLFLTQMISDYLIQPRLMKKGLDVSFLQVTLSLMIWGFLLGPIGAILAVPLTMTVKKFVVNPLKKANPVTAAASG